MMNSVQIPLTAPYRVLQSDPSVSQSACGNVTQSTDVQQNIKQSFHIHVDVSH